MMKAQTAHRNRAVMLSWRLQQLLHSHQAPMASVKFTNVRLSCHGQSHKKTSSQALPLWSGQGFLTLAEAELTSVRADIWHLRLYCHFQGLIMLVEPSSHRVCRQVIPYSGLLLEQTAQTSRLHSLPNAALTWVLNLHAACILVTIEDCIPDRLLNIQNAWVCVGA